jgi:pimeloyl-ACP methyl ester carboxylesterase
MPTVSTVVGIDLSLVEQGTGPAVILVHGFPELAYSWRHQVPALAAAGMRAIAYDQRGYGGSSKPEAIEAYRLTELAGDVIGLADALGIGTFSLIGHDWGSIVVFAAAVLHPERVDRLVTLNVPYLGWPPVFPTTEVLAGLGDRFRYVLAFQEPGKAEARFARDPHDWMRRTFSGVAGQPDFPEAADLAVYVEAMTTGGLSGPLGFYRNIDRNAADFERYSGTLLGMPTLMVVVDRDPILPPSMTDGMEGFVPNLTVVHIDECGHWTQQEQPEAVNRALIEFLSPS